MKRQLSLEQACNQYPHRYTMEHVPAWANQPHFHSERQEWLCYAPQFRTDKEWYDTARFPGEDGHHELGADCYSSGQTWPLGQWLAR